MDKITIMQRMEQIGMKWEDLLYVLGIEESELDHLLKIIEESSLEKYASAIHFDKLPLDIVIQATNFLDSNDALKLSSCCKQLVPLRRYIFGNRRQLVLGSAIECIPQFIKDYTQRIKILKFTDNPCDENKLKLHCNLMETFADVREIDIHYRGCFDIELLSKFNHLQKLHMNTIGIKDLSAISRFKYLQDLDIRDDSFRLSTEFNTLDMSLLCPLLHLRKLTIAYRTLANIPATSNIIHLEDLKLVKTNINSVSDLAPLVNLINLNIRFSPISDIKILKNMKKLKTLKLTTMKPFVIDTEPLVHFHNLVHLELSRYQISDISFLSCLLCLKWLSLVQNDISNLAPLQLLSNLEYLNLSENNITDLSG
ncbi:hypothetical protein BC833DRAFT_248860, partial [Globomyces pollinis-pini]